MDQGTDRIAEDLKEIVRTRGAIADKLDLIERRLASSVEEAWTKADDVIDRTQTTMFQALDSVKAATDPRRLANDHPWLLLSGAIAVGMTLGTALHASRRRSGVTPYYPPKADAADVMPSEGTDVTRREGVYPYYPDDRPRTRRVDTDRETSLLGDLGGVVAHELNQVRDELIAMASGILRAWVRETVRHVVASAVPPDTRPPIRVREQDRPTDDSGRAQRRP